MLVLPAGDVARFALLLHGLVGTILWSPSASLYRGEQGSPKLIKFTSASHVAHIVSPTAGGVDVFAHSWNPELGPYIDLAYGRHLRGSLHQAPEYAEKVRTRLLRDGSHECFSRRA